MATVDAFGDLLRMGAPVVTNSEAAARMKCAERTAYKRLRAMEQAGLVARVKPGLWLLDSNLSPLALPPYLTAPMPAYVSLTSALALHGLIEQIPRQISVISLDRPRRIPTSLGIYAVHRIDPDLFGGFDGDAGTGFIASAEKALFDMVYIRAAAGSVAYFPELKFGPGFDRQAVTSWTDRINSARLKTIVERRLVEVLGHPR